MSRPDIEPVTITKELGPGRTEVEKHAHPAFAQIGAYRSQGGHRALYDSDFMHNATITIRLSRSTFTRNLSTDWHHGRDEIVEVEMSEAQWATFVSSMNVGSGVPCTLRHIEGRRIPYLPDPASRTEQFGDEIKEAAKESLDALNEMLTEIDGMGLSKKKTDDLKLKLRIARDKLMSNMPFIVERFDEHMEETTERAKAEVHGYITGVVQRAGLEHLGAPITYALTAPPED